MSDKRSHRGTPRHWEEQPFEYEGPPIRRASRPFAPTAAPSEASPVQGTVKWFNAEKGFGFIALQSGGEAFIHVSRLKAAGLSDAPEGAAVTVRMGPGRKGPEVVEILEMGEAAPKPARASPAAQRFDPPAQTETTEVTGTVKWFNPAKGFGFVGVGDRQKDVFVSARTLAQAGLNDLREGQRVQMKVIAGQKGPEARSISVVG
ncbi:MAG TPA: cold shock domain-containing protein [Pyrinomonadaceae bacterium]|nr:cold shock domain-containing protein [Pyrinomonadaceae bacterium]